MLDTRLDGREFLVDDISIADFATFPWVRKHAWGGVTVDDMPHLRRWLQTMAARPGVQRGLDVPEKQATLERRSDTENVAGGRRIII